MGERGGGGWYLRQPSVQEKIDHNIENQGWIPHWKIWAGFSFGMVALYAGLILWGWLVPARLALDISWLLFAFIAMTGAIMAAREYVISVAYARLLSSSVLAVVSGITSFFISRVGIEWWEVMPPSPDGGIPWLTLFGLGLFLVSGGASSAYYYGKELVVVYELTGSDKANLEIRKMEMERERERDELEDERWRIEHGMLEAVELRFEIVHYTQVTDKNGRAVGKPVRRNVEYGGVKGVGQDRLSEYTQYLLDGGDPSGRWRFVTSEPMPDKYDGGLCKIFSKDEYAQLEARMIDLGVIETTSDAPNAHRRISDDTRHVKAVLKEMMRQCEK